MCWNAEVSLNTFIMTSICLVILYLVNYNPFYLIFVFLYIFMQLIEYFMWTNIDNKKTLVPLSILSFIIIFIQPIILLLFTKHRWLIKYYILANIIWFVFCYIQGNLHFSFAPYVAKNKHLSWNWTDNEIYMFGFFTIYLIILFGTSFVYINSIIFIIAVISLLYSIYNHFQYKTIASIWCWMVNFFTIILVIHALCKEYIPQSRITYLLGNSIYDIMKHSK